MSELKNYLETKLNKHIGPVLVVIGVCCLIYGNLLVYPNTYIKPYGEFISACGGLLILLGFALIFLRTLATGRYLRAAIIYISYAAVAAVPGLLAYYDAWSKGEPFDMGGPAMVIIPSMYFIILGIILSIGFFCSFKVKK